MSVLNVTQPNGGVVEVPMFSEAEIEAMVKDSSPQVRKALMDHMKLLGRPITELVRMTKPEDRKAFILSRYKDLGGGAKGKGKANGAAGKATPAAKPTRIGKPAAAKAAPAEPEEDEDDEEEEVSAAAAAGSEDVEQLKAQVTELHEKLDELTETIGELARFTLEAHAILRATAHMSAGLEESDVVELAQATRGELALNLDEDDAGN